MLKSGYISCFENIIDPDQMALEKPSDQDPHIYHCLKTTGILQVNRIKLVGVKLAKS